MHNRKASSSRSDSKSCSRDSLSSSISSQSRSRSGSDDVFFIDLYEQVSKSNMSQFIDFVIGFSGWSRLKPVALENLTCSIFKLAI